MEINFISFFNQVLLLFSKQELHLQNLGTWVALFYVPKYFSGVKISPKTSFNFLRKLSIPLPILLKFSIFLEKEKFLVYNF